MARPAIDFGRTWPNDGTFEHTPGQRALDVNGREFIFVRATNTISATQCAAITESHTCHRITTPVQTAETGAGSLSTTSLRDIGVGFASGASAW